MSQVSVLPTCPLLCTAGSRLSNVLQEQWPGFRAANYPHPIGQSWSRVLHIASGGEGAEQGGKSGRRLHLLPVPAQKERGVGGLRLLEGGSESPPEGREEGTDQRSRTGTSGGPATLGNSEVQSRPLLGHRDRQEGRGGVALCARKQTGAGLGGEPVPGGFLAGGRAVQERRALERAGSLAGDPNHSGPGKQKGEGFIFGVWRSPRTAGPGLPMEGTLLKTSPPCCPGHRAT